MVTEYSKPQRPVCPKCGMAYNEGSTSQANTVVYFQNCKCDNWEFNRKEKEQS